MKTLIEADRETEDSSLENSTSSNNHHHQHHNNQLTPISKSESTSIVNNNRTKRIELLSIERKGKRLKFMINGNRFFRGIRYCLCTERIRCFDVLLEDLNRLIKDVNLPKGIQYIYSYSTEDKLSRVKLESLDEFKDNQIYICSSNDNYIELDYGSISQGFDYPGGIGGFNQLSKSISCTAADQRIKTMTTSPFNPHNHHQQQSSGSGSPPTNEFIRPKLVNIIINGPKPREVIKLLLNKRSVHSYDQLLTDIQAKSRTLFTPIRRVYHLNGKKVTKLKDFFSNQDIFIVSTSDKRNNQDFEIHPEECNNIHFGRFLLGKGNVSLSSTSTNSTASSTIPPPPPQPSSSSTVNNNNSKRYNNFINDPTITSSTTSSPTKSTSRQSNNNNTINSSPSTSIIKTVSQEIDSSSSLSSSSSSSVWLENVNLRDLSLENDVFTPDIYDPVSSTTKSTMTTTTTTTKNNNNNSNQHSYQRKYLNNSSTLIPMSASRVSLNEYSTNNQRDYPVRRNTTTTSNRNSIGGISSNNINDLGENVSYGQTNSSRGQHHHHNTSSSSSTTSTTTKDKVKHSHRKHTNTLRASDGNIVYQDPLKSNNRTNHKHHHNNLNHHQHNNNNNNYNHSDNLNNDKNTKRKSTTSSTSSSTPSVKYNSRIPILQGLTQLPRRINSTINCAKVVSSSNNNNKITSSSNNYVNCSTPTSNSYSTTLSLLFPREINRKYSVGNIIGDGNFAVVHECTNRGNNVKYAIKIINKKKCRGSEVSKSEVAILRKINHPFIIQLVEDYDFPNEMYLVMELVAGGDLFDAITSKNRYSEKEARGMVTNLLQALAYLHSLNICHRDIKPENLLVSSKKDGKMFIKLADFGLAVKILPGQKLYEVCGTPIYVAPEILAETGYDYKVDVWAAGVIAYILLCGYPPFVSMNNDNDELFDLILKGSFEFLHQYWSTVSEDAKDFISRLLVVNQNDRLSSLEALRDSWISEDINPHW